MGSPIRVFGSAKTFGNNPWVGTGLAKKPYYFREPVPWDKRRQGTEALSNAQKQATQSFTQAAKADMPECARKSGMARNVCRVKTIGSKLRGRTY